MLTRLKNVIKVMVTLELTRSSIPLDLVNRYQTSMGGINYELLINSFATEGHPLDS